MAESYEMPWFEWNGKRASDYGIVTLTLPDIGIRPLERVSSTTIPGRSGSLTLLEGDDIYDNIALSTSCIIEKTIMTESGKSIDAISRISAWLKGSGTIKFSNKSNGFYKGRVANQISFAKVLRGYDHRTFSIQFSCDPFFYLDSGSTKFSVTSSKTVSNLGNIPSLPLLKVTGTGEGSIMCGGSTILVDDFSNVSYIMIDCESKMAYKGSRDSASDPLTLLNTRISGDWLTIPDGTSIMSISGGVESVEVTPRWRCI